MDNIEQKIVDLLQNSTALSSKEIFDNLSPTFSYSTLKRKLSNLKNELILSAYGKGKATKYSISNAYNIHNAIDMETYYSKEIDERKILEQFNSDIVKKDFRKIELFTVSELSALNDLQNIYKSNIAGLSHFEYKNELERLAIDLSWKSSQIEGNTYSLLETERLLKDKETAAGKTKEEAVMLLNHKDTLDFILENPNYLKPVTVSAIEDIHSLLIKELPIPRNLRKRRVGISGTNYRPLDNEFLIKEALSDMCVLINQKDNVFEKAFLALILISYIQPFVDGNKRTARIVSNAVLIQNGYCPLSFRTVDSVEYKKAMLLFYEQNNIYNFKKIFVEQFEFAVKTYF